MPAEVLEKIFVGNHTDGLENLRDLAGLGKVSHAFRNKARVVTESDKHFRNNSFEYKRIAELIVDSSVRQTLEKGGNHEMEPADLMLGRNGLFASSAAKDCLRECAVTLYMMLPQVQRDGEGSLLARAAAHHGLSNPDAQQRAAREVFSSPDGSSGQEIESWISRTNSQTGARPPHPIHAKIARFGLEKPAFVHEALMSSFSETLHALAYFQYRAVFIPGVTPGITFDLPSLAHEMSSGNPKLKQFLLREATHYDLRSEIVAEKIEIYGSSMVREALMFKASRDIDVSIRFKLFDKDWNEPSAIADHATQMMASSVSDGWGDACPTHDAVVGMISSILMKHGLIDYADLARQGEAASRATVAHMFLDAVDTEMKPGNEREPDWTDPKSLDSVHDKLTRDIEAKVGSDEDRSTLGLNDAAFGEQTRARGLARLVQYEAVTSEEAERSYGRAFMDKAH